MSELTKSQPLFEGAPPLPLVPESSPKEDKPNEKLAREFVKWCCSFGNEFRNSPDATNARFWAARMKLRLKDDDVQQIVTAARPIFLKRLEQLTRKADPAN